MSQISTLYDALVSIIQSALGSDWKQFPNPYTLEDNPQQFLEQGWGIKVGPAENTEIYTTCKASIKRRISVPLTRQIKALRSKTTAKAGIEKELLEAHYLLMKQFESDPQLNSAADSSKWLSDGGIDTPLDKGKYFLLEIEFEVEYTENLT